MVSRTNKKEYGKDCYALTADDTVDTSLFKMWAKYRYDVSFDIEEATSHVELPSEQQKKKARELREQGALQREIAQAVGRTQGWVSKNTKKDKKGQIEAVHQLHNQGKTNWSIAKELGVSPHTIKSWLTK